MWEVRLLAMKGVDRERYLEEERWKVSHSSALRGWEVKLFFLDGPFSQHLLYLFTLYNWYFFHVLRSAFFVRYIKRASLSNTHLSLSLSQKSF
jgi:hypothetical protein